MFKFNINKVKFKKNILSTSSIFLSIMAVISCFAGFSFDKSAFHEECGSILSECYLSGNYPYLKVENEENDEIFLNYQTYVTNHNNMFYNADYFETAILSSDVNDDSFVVGLEHYGKPTFLISNTFSNHLDTEDNIILDNYYFELMFKDSNTSFVGEVDNFCYIYQSTADELIEHDNGITNYEDLINTSLKIKSGNEYYNWKIANIIIDSTGFSSSLIEMFGLCILCYTFLPKDFNIFLIENFHGNDFENIQKISEIRNMFKSENFKISLKNCNIAKFDYYANGIWNYSPLFYVLITIFVFSLLLSLVLSFYSLKLGNNLFLYNFLSIAVVFSLFNLLDYFSIISNLYFSILPCIITMILMLLMFAIWLIIKIHSRRKHVNYR